MRLHPFNCWGRDYGARADGAIFERNVEGVWRRLDDVTADRIAVNAVIDEMPGPLGEWVRLMRSLMIFGALVQNADRVTALLDERAAGVRRALDWVKP